MQKNKSIKKILQICTIIGTILPINLLYLTHQLVLTEKDSTIFNLDNFDKTLKRDPLVPGDTFGLFDCTDAEQKKWCSTWEYSSLRFEVITESTAGAPHGSVKVYADSSQSINTIIYNLSIQPFIIGPDERVYDVREFDNAVFSPESDLGGNVVLVFNDPKIQGVVIPSGIAKIGNSLFVDSLRSPKQLFPTSGKFSLSFYVAATDALTSGKLFNNLEPQTFFEENQFTDFFLTNGSPSVSYPFSKNLVYPKDRPSLARLETVHLNGFETATTGGSGPGTSTDPFLSCQKIKDVYLYNSLPSPVSNYQMAPSYPTNPNYFFDTQAKMDATKILWQNKFPNTKCSVKASQVADVIAELPPDLNLVFNKTTPEKNSLKFSAYTVGDYIENEAELTAKFYFNGDETKENLNFTLDKITTNLTEYEEYYQKIYQINVKNGLDPSKQLVDGKYPCEMVLSSKIDPSIQKKYKFDLQVKGNPIVPVESVHLNPDSMNLLVGDEPSPLHIDILPGPCDNRLTWTSSDESVAVVEPGFPVANIIPKNVGTTEITATSVADPSKSDKCIIIVAFKDPTSIKLSKSTISTNVSIPTSLTYNVLPNPGASQEVELTLDDPKIATVFRSGNTITVTPKSIGSTKLWVETKNLSNPIKAACDLTITPDLPTGIVINSPPIIGNIGKTHQLSATITPATADQEAVQWSTSDRRVAVVNETTGLVTFIGLGQCQIRATAMMAYPTITASCDVEVTEIVPTALKLDRDNFSGKINETFKITATITPADADQSVSWESNDPSVATVDNDGNVKLISNGSTSITATSVKNPKLEATCAIEVPKIVPTSLTLDRDVFGAKIGATTKLVATIGPADADQSVSWKSNDPSVATVDNNGNVELVALGTTDIIAESIDKPGLTAKCRVTVSDNLPTTIEIDPSSFVGKVNNTFKITAKLGPEGADQSVAWKSDNVAIAIVDGQGNVTLISIGEANIIVTSTVNSALFKTCKITTVENVNAGMIVGATIAPIAGIGAVTTGSTIYVKKTRRLF